LIRDIPAGDGKIGNLFLQCIIKFSQLLVYTWLWHLIGVIKIHGEPPATEVQEKEKPGWNHFSQLYTEEN
jgi:hypothetical protein